MQSLDGWFRLCMAGLHEALGQIVPLTARLGAAAHDPALAQALRAAAMSLGEGQGLVAQALARQDTPHAQASLHCATLAALIAQAESVADDVTGEGAAGETQPADAPRHAGYSLPGLRSAPPEVADAVIAGMMQHLALHLIARVSTLRALSERLGHDADTAIMDEGLSVIYDITDHLSDLILGEAPEV